MLTVVDDTTSGNVTTFLFNDSSEVKAIQQHQESPPSFKLTDPSEVSEEQKKAIYDWSACPVS